MNAVRDLFQTCPRSILTPLHVATVPTVSVQEMCHGHRARTLIYVVALASPRVESASLPSRDFCFRAIGGSCMTGDGSSCSVRILPCECDDESERACAAYFRLALRERDGVGVFGESAPLLCTLVDGSALEDGYAPDIIERPAKSGWEASFLAAEADTRWSRAQTVLCVLALEDVALTSTISCPQSCSSLELEARPLLESRDRRAIKASLTEETNRPAGELGIKECGWVRARVCDTYDGGVELARYPDGPTNNIVIPPP